MTRREETIENPRKTLSFPISKNKTTALFEMILIRNFAVKTLVGRKLSHAFPLKHFQMETNSCLEQRLK